MRADYRELRARQLDESLAAFSAAKNQVRPVRGWLRAIREALGMTLEGVAIQAKTTKQHIRQLEFAEAHDRITLRSLRRVAEAMGCTVVYAITPKSGTIQELAEKNLRDDATRRVVAVEHSMSLEDQASGDLKRKIDDEVKRMKARKK
jgi:predicted DNA-binding mobile mystery protein A